VIGELQTLESLRFWGLDMDDGDFGRLTNLKGLGELSLARTSVGDESLQLVSTMTSLRELALGGTHVTDDGGRRADIQFDRASTEEFVCPRSGCVRDGLEA
jgi:hypothetical protein